MDSDQAGIAGAQNHGAALVADLLVGALDHAMALSGAGGTNLAGSGHFEALFG